MNISPITFGQRTYNTARTNNVKTANKRPQTKPAKAHNKKPIVPIPAKTFLAGIIITTGVNACVANNADKINAVVIPFNSQNTRISDIAQTYNSDIDAIYSINDINEESNLSEVKELKIPQKYDNPINEKIEKLQKKLYKSNLSEIERENTEIEIKELRKEKAIQDNIANIYTDGKFAYFSLIEPSEDAPVEVDKIYSYNSINVETFKDLFNIKDGAIRKYNDISYSYQSDNPDYGYYKDFSHATIHAGDVIKVPLNAIKN